MGGGGPVLRGGCREALGSAGGRCRMGDAGRPGLASRRPRPLYGPAALRAWRGKAGAASGPGTCCTPASSSEGGGPGPWLYISCRCCCCCQSPCCMGTLRGVAGSAVRGATIAACLSLIVGRLSAMPWMPLTGALTAASAAAQRPAQAQAGTHVSIAGRLPSQARALPTSQHHHVQACCIEATYGLTPIQSD